MHAGASEGLHLAGAAHQAAAVALTIAVTEESDYLAVKAKMKAKIDNSERESLTLTVDGWTNARKQSVLAFVLLFPDGTSVLLETKELYAESHTAETVAGE